jgi:uncharacterized protein HemX
MAVTTDDTRANVLRRIGSQPIVLGTATLVAVVVGIAFTLLWRTYAGLSPQEDRTAAMHLLQARTAQASEKLVEKTRDLATTQQESIDQLQQVQDQLQSMKRLLSAQQTETKRLSDEVSGLTSAIDTLRQSFANAEPSEASNASSPRHSATRRHRTRRQSANP